MSGGKAHKTEHGHGEHRKAHALHGPVAIIGGTGAEGRGLGLRWARAGLEIIVGSRDAARAQQTANEIAGRAGDKARVRGAENAAAVAESKIVVLTVPFIGQAEMLKHLKGHFQPDTVVVDTTVPLATGIGGRATRTVGVWQGSAAQQTAELVPPGVKVAAAFQNIAASTLNNDAPLESDVIVCSDDPAAAEVAFELARRIPGVRPVDGGKLENARIMEQLTALLIAINLRHNVRSAGFRITGLPGHEPVK